MTTIVYHEESKTMAADSQATWGDMISSLNIDKIHEINGSLIGFAGRLSSGLKFCKWFESWDSAHILANNSMGVNVVIPDFLAEEDFLALVVTPDGSQYMFEGGSAFYPVEGNQVIGSGMPYAFGALDTGSGAKEAVEAAIRRDVSSGGKVRVLTLQEPEEPLTREDIENMEEQAAKELLLETFGIPDQEALSAAIKEALEDVEEVLDEASEEVIEKSCDCSDCSCEEKHVHMCSTKEAIEALVESYYSSDKYVSFIEQDGDSYLVSIQDSDSDAWLEFYQDGTWEGYRGIFSASFLGALSRIFDIT
jgi:ATP-dependent protease HslVU (ClpYQ) peptidase subunit